MADLIMTIKLSEEDRARLDRIAAALESCGSCQVINDMAPTPEAPEEKPQEGPQEPAGDAPSEGGADTPPEPEKTQAPERRVSMSEIQQKVVALSAAGKKAEVRDLIKAYADRVSAIPEDKYAEVYDLLERLDAWKKEG